MAQGNLEDSLATLLFLDAPPDSLAFSVDGVEGKAGSRFTGFAGFPVGCHFLSFHDVKSMATPFPSMLFWVEEGNDSINIGDNSNINDSISSNTNINACSNAIGKRLLIFKWNAKEETFARNRIPDTLDEKAIGERLASYSQGLMPFGPFMQQEPGSLQTWKALTSFVTKSILQRLDSIFIPINNGTAPDTAVDGTFDSLIGRLTKIPSVKAFAKERLLGPAEISRLAMDQSAIVEGLGGDPEELLGELQVAFVIFRWAGDWEAFDHWLAIVRLLCNSEQAIPRIPDLFKQFLVAIQTQLLVISSERDAELFGTLITDPLLPKLLSRFTNNCKAVPDLAEAVEQFSEAMNVFGWTFSACDTDNEDEDEAPTIVE
jgi:hypothetical protein